MRQEFHAMGGQNGLREFHELARSQVKARRRRQGVIPRSALPAPRLNHPPDKYGPSGEYISNFVAWRRTGAR